MKLDILSTNGETLDRSVELPEEVFGITPNQHAVYLAVKNYLNNQRQGTHKTKGRSEVAGSTRKIKRQKGTGTARAGDIKNPLFRGGGRIFGPEPRTYSSKVNSKVKDLARKSALSEKARQGKISVVEDFSFDKPSTKSFVEVLTNLKLDGQKVLLVVNEHDRNVYLSGRNYPSIQVTEVRNLNTYEIMKAGTVLLSESAVAHFNQAN
ncbi:50S ribosomal protein L4 [Membranicola marinus]|uniref:Large ribosomal subunit protein uL4 n=1 Tax=Membranihabitans marinus TaxID=1227546 RepID=A0A953HW77_9BACT|nr:50S ribosomal protein L4 [Membranihabitans marinus]MBY5959301.1 50S ribosomal protein L4 [Membranihabitans marinus]